MPSSAELLDLYVAYAAWEAAETLFTDAYPTFHSYATFPTEDDVKASGGLLYPYTCHGCDSSRFEPAGIDPSLDRQTHNMWAIVVYAAQDDPLDQLSERDAVWRNLYRRGWLRHLRLTDKNIDLSGVVMTATQTGFDLFGRQEIGVKFTWPVSTRVLLTAGE